METLLARSAEQGLRVLVLRSGDFFGPNAPGSWFQNVLVATGKPLRRVVYPGDRNVGHAWVPDLGEAAAQLGARDADLDPFAVFHFGGHYFARGIEFTEAIREAAGAPYPPIRSFPWPAVYLATPFSETLREMIEMRYLWRNDVRLDNSELVDFLGAEPHTPLPEAIRVTLAALGCLKAGKGNRMDG